jgi:hypothetical protein
MKLTAQEELARQLVGETLCDLRTARKYVMGEPLRESVRRRLAEAEKRIRTSGKRAVG